MGLHFIGGQYIEGATYAEANAKYLKANPKPGPQKFGAPKVGVAPVIPPPLNPLLALVKMTATPVEVLATRGVTGTQVHLGLGEEVTLGLTTPPPGGTQVKWSIAGDAGLSKEMPTTATLTAGDTPGIVTLKLKVENGPNRGHVLDTHEFKVVAPSGSSTRQAPDEPLLRHQTGTAGVGFKMWINLLPNNVVFSRLEWREHIGLGIATGHFEGENGRIHAPSGAAYNPANAQPVDQKYLSVDWMPVYGVEAAPYGINWIGQVDTVDTGDHPPHVPAAAGTPARWRASSHWWSIEWRYRVKRSNGQWGGEKLLERAMHESTIDANGTARIKKGDAGFFTVVAGAPTSGYV
jgi:hypothetical protein